MGLKRTRKKNQPKNVRYSMEKRWIKNKIEKLERHLEKYDKDEYAKKALKKLKNEKLVVVIKEEG